MKDNLLETNSVYKANVNRWQFYLRSYMGGEDFADGEYLTRYVKEDDDEYQKRIGSTPCDNHCKNIVQIYNSFIWRVPPTRELPDDPVIDAFMKDADLDGRSFNAFMREAGAWASVYGHCWIVVDKPSSQAETRRDEIDMNLRPYVSVITPENVLDWRYERTMSGRYRLSYLKIRESLDKDTQIIRIWEDEIVSLYEVKGDESKLVEQVDNPLGRIPAVALYSARSPIRGVGISDITDIADFQKAIYSELSEIEQLIRISNHPSLVIGMEDVENASAGAGSVVAVNGDDANPLKPYLLQPSAASLSGVMESIGVKVEAINRMSHMGGVRATEKQTKSGVALQTEFQLLNTRLSEKADLLELAEEQIWELFNLWQDRTDEITVDYPDSFDIRDYEADLQFFQTARASGLKSDTFIQGVDKKIAALVLEENELAEAYNEIESAVAIGSFPIVEDEGGE